MAKYYAVLKKSGNWTASQEPIWGADFVFRKIVNAKSSTQAIAKAKVFLKKDSYKGRK